MKINEETLIKIENIFGFQLYEEQKKYLLLPRGSIYYWNGGRCSGKTFVYCIKLALSEGEPLDFKRKKYNDEFHDVHYDRWFKRYFYDIWTTLKENGFKVREIKSK